MMGKYIDDSDVLISTYNKDSPMNSGAMIISFSYWRMVIVSNIYWNGIGIHGGLCVQLLLCKSRTF